MPGTDRKRAIIIGATSGIGEALARQLAAQSYKLGLAGRRVDRLEAIADELKTTIVHGAVDVRIVEQAQQKFDNLVARLGSVELVIISAGWGERNPDLDDSIEQETVDTNVCGFVAFATAAYRHFKAHGHGHLVGISSIAALRGNAVAPAYSASKAFMSNYLEGLRVRAFRDKLDIAITDVRPGFVDTAMAKSENPFWVASPQKAAGQIMRAIERRQRIVYITRRWRLMAWLLQILPGDLYKRL